MKKHHLLLRPILLVLLGTLSAATSRAGEAEPEATPSMESFLQAFLREQPRFRANGTFVSKVPGKAPVTSGARVRFDKDVGAVFSYNTTGADLEPYDFYYWNGSLALFVYDRSRQNIIKSELQGAPLRPVFNFVWDVLDETEKGSGIRTLIFSGLMRGTVERGGESSTDIIFRKRLASLPVKEIAFRFDAEYRLESMSLLESNGSSHSFQVLQFQNVTEKLPIPKVQKKAPERH